MHSPSLDAVHVEQRQDRRHIVAISRVNAVLLLQFSDRRIRAHCYQSFLHVLGPCCTHKHRRVAVVGLAFLFPRCH